MKKNITVEWMLKNCGCNMHGWAKLSSILVLVWKVQSDVGQKCWWVDRLVIAEVSSSVKSQILKIVLIGGYSTTNLNTKENIKKNSTTHYTLNLNKVEDMLWVWGGGP